MSVALTSEATAKALPKEEGKDHIILFKVGFDLYTSYMVQYSTSRYVLRQ